MSSTRRLLLFLLAILLGGCHHHATPAGAREAESDDVVLVVENHHWNDVVVSIAHDGIVDRVGTVTAASTQTFVLPASRFGQDGVFRLVAHPIGSDRTLASEQLIVRPGQEVRWTLEASLERSSAGVY
jgi:hypothetical protein